MKYTEEDVKALCQAVIADPVYFDYDSNGPDYYRCRYCSNVQRDSKDLPEFIHEYNCPTLLARAILAA